MTADAVHFLGAVTCVVFQYGSTGRTPSKTMRLAEILHSKLNIGVGMIKVLHLTFISNEAGRSRQNLHQADFARAPSGFGAIIAFNFDHGQGQFQRNAIGLCMFCNHVTIEMTALGHFFLTGETPFLREWIAWFNQRGQSIFLPTISRLQPIPETWMIGRKETVVQKRMKLSKADYKKIGWFGMRKAASGRQ